MSSPPSLALDAACALFEPAPGTIYLDSATYGLPPRPTVEALHAAAESWRGGSARWKEDGDLEGEACRRLFARLVGGEEREVALVPAVSVASGLVASAVPTGGEVLVAEGDFTSLLYPFLAAAEQGALRVREVPLEGLAEAVTAETWLVAVSLVQSADGRLADAAALRQAASAHGARLYYDLSQALGAVTVDAGALGADYLACAGYKWLCCPRGVAFLWLRRQRWHEPWPLTASWRGGDDPYGRYYGSPLALAEDAARFDVSLAWHAWVGARRSLEVLAAIDERARCERAHGAALALADRLGLEPPPACIVTVPVRDAEAASRALDAAGVRASMRAGQLRLSPHFYNRVDQAEWAAELLRPFLA